MSDSWNEKHVLKIRNDQKDRHLAMTEENGEKRLHDLENPKKKFTPVELRKEIEPWLTALFQSEHLSLLTGAGISSAVHQLATGHSGAGMTEAKFSVFRDQIEIAAKESAEKAGRGKANIEDHIKVANNLLQGLLIYATPKVDATGKLREGITKKLCEDIAKLVEDLNRVMTDFINAVLKSENNVVSSGRTSAAADKLMSFLVSFASRSTTRERLNIFTTNYDRIMEFGSELAGIRLLDRFVGSLYPLFRSSRLEVDMHYNPPGIRGRVNLF